MKPAPTFVVSRVGVIPVKTGRESRFAPLDSRFRGRRTLFASTAKIIVKRSSPQRSKIHPHFARIARVRSGVLMMSPANGWFFQVNGVVASMIIREFAFSSR